jgi:hypothetical protein
MKEGPLEVPYGPRPSVPSIFLVMPDWLWITKNSKFYAQLVLADSRQTTSEPVCPLISVLSLS